MTRRRWLLAAGGLPAGAWLPAAAGRGEAFRDWFCWLAESLFFMSNLPAEVRDCSSLLRFAYREALRPHTAEWARQWGYEWLPPFPEPRFQGTPLFRVGGEARHFADARHLMRYNTRKISTRLQEARPADLLFYRTPGGGPWHAMAYLGRSRFEPSAKQYVVYHTGPEGAWRGEVRRPATENLLAHPEPRWRPVEGNPHFLGVYRWNLLMEAG
jgi:uncharacterized protein YfaT (DUF1175 family)